MADFDKLMSKAFRLAENGLGYTSPNPPVGALILNNGDVVARGYHRRAGAPHAEIEAIQKAGAKAANSTIITTLEPCSHHGKTPPCADAIIKAGIKKVVCAIKDKNPMVAGNGYAKLRKAGGEDIIGVHENFARKFYGPYFKFITTGLPYVTLKFAQSIDGRIATTKGDSRWISSEESLKFAHKLRAINDAVLIGANTLAKDNPELTTRLVNGSNPVRIVLSNSGKLNKKRKLFIDKAAPTFVATGNDSVPGSGNGFETLKLKKGRDGLSLKELLKKLGQMNIVSLLVEGGADVSTSFMRQKLIDNVIIITAPKFLGNGIHSIGDLSINKINKAIGLQDVEWSRSGPDMVLSGRPVWS